VFIVVIDGGSMIEVLGLIKWYGDKKVVEDLIFIVFLGIVIGFFGLNGVGKFMTMWMIIGFDWLMFGSVWVNGKLYVEYIVLLVEVGALLEVCLVYIGCSVYNYLLALV